MRYHLREIQMKNYRFYIEKKRICLPVKKENERVQRFLLRGISPPSSVPEVKPTPIAVEKMPHVKRRMTRSRSD